MQYLRPLILIGIATVATGVIIALLSYKVAVTPCHPPVLGVIGCSKSAVLLGLLILGVSTLAGAVILRLGRLRHPALTAFFAINATFLTQIMVMWPIAVALRAALFFTQLFIAFILGYVLFHRLTMRLRYKLMMAVAALVVLAILNLLVPSSLVHQLFL